MKLYHEEKEYLKAFKAKVMGDGEISKKDLLEIVEKFEDSIEMTSVTVKIIDRLMNNIDRLKLQAQQESTTVKKD
ncbi:MAG: hypothetical protein RIC35_11645 [Marinoscillum sp.]